MGIFAALGAAGAVFGGISGDRAAKNQARAMRQNAAAAAENAKLVRKQAELEASFQQLEASKLLGETKAGFAASGVSGGSEFAVMAESVANAEMDRLNIIFGGEIKARNLEGEASSLRSQARDINKSRTMNLLASGFQAAGAFAKNGGGGGSRSSSSSGSIGGGPRGIGQTAQPME